MLLSTQIYIIHGNQWLMLLRNKKKKDVNHNKWIAVGGKKEPGETIEECAVREAFEETGLHCELLEYQGLVHFEYQDNEPEDIYVYTCSQYHGSLHETDEGTLRWIDENELMNLELWEGDRIFLKKMLDQTGEPFEITLQYDGQGTLLNVREERDN
jgi:8-oxo-dGTP diphosphatase